MNQKNLKKLAYFLIISTCFVNGKGICSDNKNHIHEPEWTFNGELENIKNSMDTICHKYKDFTKKS